MIAIALMLAAVQSEATADRLNFEYTSCLFAASRAAHRDGQSLGEFRSTLARSCLKEEAALRVEGVVALVGRGESQGAARKTIEQAIADGRAAVVEAYSWGTQN